MAENQDLFQNKHSSQRGFEFDEECLPAPKGTGGGDQGELKCCGDYPGRVPYHDKNGGRDCCTDKVFNTGDKQCCSDGSLAAIDGTC